MTEAQHEDPMVRLDPQDAGTAQAAGVEFARALTGAPPDWFALALEEQEAIIRAGIRRAGYPNRQARLAAAAFDTGARGEWQRIARAALPTWGMA